jgi:dihydrofolate reductase
MKHPVYIIVAMDENNGIGKDGDLPWRLKKEMQYFAKTTKSTDDPNKQNMVVMGRKTWESLPEKYRPLPDRQNVILTRNQDFEAQDQAQVAHDLDSALKLADEHSEKIFIIGGGQIFQQAINHPDLTGIYITRIHHNFDCDTFFPGVPDKFPRLKELGEEQEGATNFSYHLHF